MTIARLVLSAVFAVAAVGKLADPTGTRQAAHELGAPEGLAGLTARLLPLFELAIAIALLAPATARASALAALALLCLFTVQVVRALLGGARPDCHCFGRVHYSAASWGVVARDSLLAATAGFVVISPASSSHDSVLSWLSGVGPGEMIVLAVALIEGVALVLVFALARRLVRRYGKLLLRIDELEGRRPQSGLRVGSDAPGFSLSTFEGKQRSLVDLIQGGSALLVFSDPTCGPCVELLPAVAGWHVEPAPLLRPVLITTGELASNQSALKEHGLETALWDEYRGVAEAYGVLGTPSAVLVSQTGLIASETALGAPAIKRLVDEITDVSRAAAPTTSSSEAPARGRRRAPHHLLTRPPTEVHR
jgi:peroxiredoxin